MADKAPRPTSRASFFALLRSSGSLPSGQGTRAVHIAVNTITPATAKTRILDELKPEFIDYMLSRIPRGRFLEVEEAASMVGWLVSPENSFTTAAIFDLSGGRATY